MKKAAILRGRKLFAQVARTGRRVDSGILTCKYAPIDPSAARGRRLLVGFRVTSKLKAVQRNRLKRLMREAMRAEYTSFVSSLPSHVPALGMILTVIPERAPNEARITFGMVHNDTKTLCRLIAQRLGGHT